MRERNKRLPFRQRLKLRLINFYPPFVGAGIRVRWSHDGRRVLVRLKPHWWNRNFVGTHFGGSLYAMTDPFFVLLLYERLGWDYIVWSKSASVRFLKPGRGTLSAHFELEDRHVDSIRKKAATGEPVEPVFVIEVVDGAGEPVARIEQTLHVRRRRR